MRISTSDVKRSDLGREPWRTTGSISVDRPFQRMSTLRPVAAFRDMESGAATPDVLQGRRPASNSATIWPVLSS